MAATTGGFGNSIIGFIECFAINTLGVSVLSVC